MTPATDTPMKSVTVWLPVALVEQLDAHLASQVAHVPGARVSRHAWLACAIQAALESPRTLEDVFRDLWALVPVSEQQCAFEDLKPIVQACLDEARLVASLEPVATLAAVIPGFRAAAERWAAAKAANAADGGQP